MIEHIKRHSRTIVSYGSVAIAASALGAAARPLVQNLPPAGSNQRIEYRLSTEGPGPGGMMGGPMGGAPSGGMPSGMPPGGPGSDMMGHPPGADGPSMGDRGMMGRSDMMGDRPMMGDMMRREGMGSEMRGGPMDGQRPMGGPGTGMEMRGGPDRMQPPGADGPSREGMMRREGSMRDRPMMDGSERRGPGDPGGDMMGRTPGADGPSMGGREGMMRDGGPRGDMGGDRDRGMMNDRGNQGHGSDEEGRGGMMNEEQQKQWEEMEKRQEEERKKMEERQLQQMKRGISQAKKGLAMMKKMFEKAAAKGTSIPTDCQAALKAAEDTFALADKAKTMEEMQEANAEDLQEHFETLNECRMTIEKIARAKQVMKRIDRDLKGLDRRWNRAKRSPTAEMQEFVTEGEGVLKQIKEKRASLEGLLKEGKMDDFEATLEDDIYGRFDDLDTIMRHLEAMRNAKRFVKEYTQRMREAEKMIARLQRLKKDTAPLEALLAKAKAQYEELKAAKPGSDEFEEALRELFEIEQEFAMEFHGDQDFGSQIDVKPAPKQEELKFNF